MSKRVQKDVLSVFVFFVGKHNLSFTHFHFLPWCLINPPKGYTDGANPLLSLTQIAFCNLYIKCPPHNGFIMHHSIDVEMSKASPGYEPWKNYVACRPLGMSLILQVSRVKVQAILLLQKDECLEAVFNRVS